MHQDMHERPLRAGPKLVVCRCLASQAGSEARNAIRETIGAQNAGRRWPDSCKPFKDDTSYHLPSLDLLSRDLPGRASPFMPCRMESILQRADAGTPPKSSRPSFVYPKRIRGRNQTWRVHIDSGPPRASTPSQMIGRRT